jgi:CHAT domain-containing protein
MTSSVMPTIFRLLNFGIIVSLGIYLYRRYGRELLQEMFEQHEKQQQAVRDEVVALGKRAQEIEHAFVIQHNFGLRLATHIEQWNSFVAHAITLRQHEKEALTTILQRKSERVARHTAWISLRRECLDEAIKEATASLTAFYADSAHAQAYIGTVLSKLEKPRLGENLTSNSNGPRSRSGHDE